MNILETLKFCFCFFFSIRGAPIIFRDNAYFVEISCGVLANSLVVDGFRYAKYVFGMGQIG